MLRQIIEGQCEELNMEMLALEIMPDHIHLFIGCKPTHRPCEVINKLKGNTARQLRLVFPDLRYLGYKQHMAQALSHCGLQDIIAVQQVMLAKMQLNATSWNSKEKMFLSIASLEMQRDKLR